MTYMKLGCTWGSGKPDFYEMILKESIIICGTNSHFHKGTYVAVCQGHNVVAVAKLLEEPVSATEKPYLEEKFKKYSIDFNSENKVASASFFTLNEDEKFSYTLQQGICQIDENNPNNKDRINKLNSIVKRIESQLTGEEKMSNYINLLLNSRNIILHGAPGTGKTYLAKQIAESMGAETCFVQFHPSYDYTDFVEGLRPSPKKEDSKEIGFELKDGVFKKFCKKALQGKDEKYVFIIDEINRGEMSKIFGELFFSIDPGYRGEKGKISTQYQNLLDENDAFYDGFYVPENVYIIGTMNDIDRNVESMDFAIRRRFAFKEITASDTQDMLDNHNWGENKPDIEAMKKRMTNLNNAISGIEGLSSAYHIGAAYFLKYDSSFDELWNYHLKPLLQEYLRGMEGADKKLEELKKAYDKQ